MVILPATLDIDMHNRNVLTAVRLPHQCCACSAYMLADVSIQTDQRDADRACQSRECQGFPGTPSCSAGGFRPVKLVINE